MDILLSTDESGTQLDWPLWIPVTSTLLPLFAVISAVAARGALWPPRWQALTIVPFFASLAGYIVPSIRRASVARNESEKNVFTLPWWLQTIVVLGVTAVLLAEPARIDLAPFLLVMLAAEMVSRLGRVIGAVVALLCMALMVAADLINCFGACNYDGSAIWLLAIVFGFWGGYTVREQLILTTQLRQAQAGLATRAANEERGRIAREVHDVIAHSLSVTMLHVTAARMALQRGSDHSTAALEALREAEQQGRRSLNEIRRTVGLLGSSEATAPPLPGLADMPNLVGEFRTAGLDATLSIEGNVENLPAGAGLGIYRIAQESLTNIAKHAPGARASVELEVTEQHIRLEIRNENSNGHRAFSAGGSGLGIKGMSERAGLLGGSLRAGPDERGWFVILEAPRPTDGSAA